jgi:hypothetical protein
MLLVVVAIILLVFAGLCIRAGSGYEVTELGREFIEFVKDEKRWPDTPGDVENMDESTRKIWDLMVEHDAVEVIPETDIREETYALGKLIGPYTEYLLDILGEPHIWMSRPIKKSVRDKAVDSLLEMGFIQ